MRVEGSLTLGDRLFFFFAYAAVRDSEVARGLRNLDVFAKHASCWLAFADDFADTEGGPDWSPWMTGAGPAWLEAGQPALARAVIDLEHAKGRITDWQQMRRVGQAQERALNSFLDAVNTIGRRDLARFLVEAAGRLLGVNPNVASWVGGLELRGLRVADRMEAYRSALTFFRIFERLGAWQHEARAVGYYDEGYAASQLWKADWERLHGDDLLGRARTLVRALEPLRT
jgi:hypothetical protein